MDNVRTAAADRALATGIRRAPLASAPAAAKRLVAEWLAGIGSTAEGRGLQELFAAAPLAAQLVEALADNSPYLWDLIKANPARLLTVLQSDPDQRLPARLAETARQVAAAADMATAMRLLRRMKSEASLLIALADIGGVWSVRETTRALTEVADTALCASVRFLLGQAVQQDKLAPSAALTDAGSGYIVLAMGKMGAFELNYSSDIDLIILFDPAAARLLPTTEPSTFFVRLTRSLVKLLQERTADGYVFRVDLRLRPDPASTQIAMSTPAALDYYESSGQNWERAALIKARPCAGDIAAGETFLKNITPFIWRKYLDYAAVADVHAMKRQIHAYRGHDQIAVEGHNVKLGRGGIREIEFFAQTQQLIAGGRHPELRDRGTLTTLAQLADGGWVGRDARADLTAAYCFLRTVEHRLQMVNDEQTHTLPSDSDALARLARFLGYPDREAFAAAFVGHLHHVQQHYAKLFEGAPAAAAQQRALVFPSDRDDSETLDNLVALGFRKPLEISAMVRNWLSGGPRSLKSTFVREHLKELVPILLEQLARSENPDAAVVAFDRFLSGLQGGGRLFLLLRQNPDLLAIVALTLGTAPRLADILARYPQAMDALLDPAFFGALPDEDKLSTELSRSLEQSLSNEDFLDRIRMFGQEHMFLIGARILSGTVSAQQAGEAFARLADVLIRALSQTVKDKFEASHGRIQGQRVALVAMGKLGGREMTATSDLDLIIIYDFDPDHPESDGARPLYGAQYFARLTQRFISALTTQTNYGALYQVDMRLRPSGRAGPLATSLQAFADYQENEAWTWEHMALTRARVVAASPGFGERVTETIRDVLGRPRDAESVAADVIEMRAAIAAEKGDKDRWELKYAAGGLVDVEFAAQYLQLVHAEKYPDILDTSTARVLEKTTRLGLLSPEDSEVLRHAAQLYHDLTQILRLCLPGPFDPKAAGAGLLGLLARAAGLPDFATLDAHLADLQRRVRASFIRILGRAV
ncbi:MAG: [glutamine synthetase] adenylyltransferase / [glutamine synthetase]-adenylyl-L-tyrosine [Alphaproteobacteria bacterium]|nr:[glutamine synthetase] adenylyltransferase / [glutamine synthetase]-adenylyl-L-tyrosine [Alphaproteobacteria bacterium]